MERDNKDSNQTYAFLKKGTIKEIGGQIRDAVLFGYSSVGLFAFVSCDQRVNYQKVDLNYLLLKGVNFDNDSHQRSAISSNSAYSSVVDLLNHAQGLDLHVECKELSDKLRTVAKFFA